MSDNDSDRDITFSAVTAAATGASLLMWDTAFFGHRIGRIDEECAFTMEQLREIDAWAHTEQVACLYASVDAAATDTVHLLEKNGFQFQNIRVVLEAEVGHKSMVPCKAALHITSFDETMAVPLAQLARENHTISRFFTDRHFDPKRSAQLYETWLLNCCRDASVQTFVSVQRGAVTGYLCCTGTKGERGSITLAGVDPTFRRQGIGTALVDAALRWFSDNNVQTATVTTQGSNTDALRLYTSMGFFHRQTALWYHKWYSGTGTELSDQTEGTGDE